MIQFFSLNDDVDARQPETKAIIRWLKEKHFTASASLHGVIRLYYSYFLPGCRLLQLSLYFMLLLYLAVLLLYLAVILTYMPSPIEQIYVNMCTCHMISILLMHF